MTYLTLSDDTRLFYKDWGPKDAQPIVFHHGWPLSADDWDNQMLFFLDKGFRVIAHDRRGHGRSDQTDTGNDMDTYAADVAELAEALDLKNAIHIGHSTGGGEVIRYVARSRPGRVAKAVLIGAVPPIMLATAAYPGGLPMAVFDGFRDAFKQNRAQFFLDVPSGPFYGFNREGAEVSEGLIRNWWRKGPIRLYHRLLRDRLHRGPESGLSAGAPAPRRGRSGRADRRVRAPGCQAAVERNPEDLSRPVPRAVRHPSGRRQRRLAGVHSRIGRV